MGEYVLETRNLVKKYDGKAVVDNVNVHVKKGDIYGLIGKNGAGKTTLMRVILGLCGKDSGEIVLFGGENLCSARAKIGSLIEEPGLYKNCTAYENLKRFSILYGADESKIPELLELVGIPDTGSKKVKNFSLGMRQRLGIAIALLNDPEMLLLDEPINGLDPTGIKEMRELFSKLNDKGITLIISSHILEELSKLVNVYGIISDGKIIDEVTSDSLEEKSRRYVIFKTSDDAKALSIFERLYPDGKAEIGKEGFKVFEPADVSGKINAALIKEGVDVFEFKKASFDIEEYFIERTEK